MIRWLLLLGLGVLIGTGGQAASEPNVTTYAHMTAQLRADSARCPLIRIVSIGKSGGGRKDLWLVRIAAPSKDTSATIKLFVLCRQHGDEPASTEAVLSLIHRLANGSDPLLRRSLGHVALYLIPMVNPDGADANIRTNAVGADLNRDWGVFHQPETRAVAKAAALIHPNVVVDAHNWDGSDEYNADCIEVPRETQTALGRADHTLQQNAVRQLAACGYAVHPTAWGPDTDPYLAHRWFTRKSFLSLLVETHSGATIDRSDFQRRQGLYVALIHGLVDHYSTVYAVEKPRMEALEGASVGSGREAKLFDPVPTQKPLPAAAHQANSYAWLWALGVFGLALWGGKRVSDVGDPREAIVRLPGRYSVARKREGTETRARSGQRKPVSIPPR